MVRVTDFGFSALGLRRATPPLLAAACSCMAAFGLPALAEQAKAAPDNAASRLQGGDAVNGRYTMTPVAGGFLRLDTRSGQVSLCMVAAGQAQCRSSADERAALEAEIGRLAEENAALKAQAPKAAPSAQEDADDRKFDHALDRAEKFMRRMMQLFRDSNGAPPPASL